ncbi:MAG: hypothetical protein ACU85E_08645 [Gammaproteobacteria bacterium]
MNIRLLKLLAASCSFLVVVIVAEWQYASYSKSQLFKNNLGKTEQAYTAGNLPNIELAQQPEDSYDEMTSRPLFIEGRRPVLEAEDDSEQTAVPMEKFEWQLDGVYLHQNTSVALFSRTQARFGQAKHLKKSLGEVIDGWTLAEVVSDKVVLEQDGEQQELMLRKPKPTKLPAQPNSKAAPRPAIQGENKNPFLRKSTK